MWNIWIYRVCAENVEKKERNYTNGKGVFFHRRQQILIHKKEKNEEIKWSGAQNGNIEKTRHKEQIKKTGGTIPFLFFKMRKK